MRRGQFPQQGIAVGGRSGGGYSRAVWRALGRAGLVQHAVIGGGCRGRRDRSSSRCHRGSCRSHCRPL